MAIAVGTLREMIDRFQDRGVVDTGDEERRLASGREPPGNPLPPRHKDAVAAAGSGASALASRLIAR